MNPSRPGPQAHHVHVFSGWPRRHRRKVALLSGGPLTSRLRNIPQTALLLVDAGLAILLVPTGAWK
jgi:hypothetical protein